MALARSSASVRTGVVDRSLGGMKALERRSQLVGHGPLTEEPGSQFDAVDEVVEADTAVVELGSGRRGVHAVGEQGGGDSGEPWCVAAGGVAKQECLIGASGCGQVDAGHEPPLWFVLEDGAGRVSFRDRFAGWCQRSERPLQLSRGGEPAQSAEPGVVGEPVEDGVVVDSNDGHTDGGQAWAKGDGFAMDLVCALGGCAPVGIAQGSGVETGCVELGCVEVGCVESVADNGGFARFVAQIVGSGPADFEAGVGQDLCCRLFVEEVGDGSR